MGKLRGILWAHTLSLGLSLGLSAGLLGTGCTDDPNDPKTWIKKLDDVREQKEAIRQLERLKDESALAPLTKLYMRSKDPQHLRAITKLRSDKAVDLFIEQLDYSDDSFENASFAATGLAEIALRDDKGREAAKKAVPDLIKTLSKKLPIKTRANVVKVEAMKALVAIKDPRAVEAIGQVVETSADDQDFFLNKQAARHLGEFADPKSIPSLVRGLFMTGRGTDIFTDCRIALTRIGDPAVEKIVEAMQRKNKQLEEDAKKYEFVPGIIVQKTAMLLGDLRSKTALPALTAELNKKDDGLSPNGVSGHQSVLQAIGLIGDPASAKVLIGVLSDAKRNGKHRAAAAEGLNLLGATDALPAMLALAKTPYYNSAKQEIDSEKGTLAAQGVTQYSRLVDKDDVATLEALAKAAPAETDAEVAFKNALERAKVAKECKLDVACNGKMLADPASPKSERAAFSLGRAGRPALPVLVKHVGHRDTTTRFAIMLSLSRIATKSDQDVLKAMQAQIDLDKSKDRTAQALADEMRVVQAIIQHR